MQILKTEIKLKRICQNCLKFDVGFYQRFLHGRTPSLREYLPLRIVKSAPLLHADNGLRIPEAKRLQFYGAQHAQPLSTNSRMLAFTLIKP